MCWPGWPYQPHGSGFESREESDTDQDSRERMRKNATAVPLHRDLPTFGLKQSSNLRVASTPRGVPGNPPSRERRVVLFPPSQHTSGLGSRVMAG
eukprot:CAMPEP_0119536984 /NCGR_PEP_ID=MMETSP1344-20130328/49753_1 /TAXON_ID=236787 /ORGANISM="Florenciella parvula, Strain CCMP2471" /LENGTH=94 /DNA_ID=CAMNT_0007579313 /DNA_START=103 /DNA_END=384 /DNA_ORIENTATION=+